MFSQNRLDPASALLLEHVELPHHGMLFDIACGSGILGLGAKLQQPNLDIHLYDTSALALYSSQMNAQQLNLKATIAPSNMLSSTRGKANVILCNPPFHQGIKTDYQAYQCLLADSHKKLHKNGILWLVANQHLPYEQLAKQTFKHVHLQANANGFKLLKLHN